MNANVFSDGVQTTLHAIAQFLLVPVMVALIVLVVYALYQVGTLIAEHVTEHSKLRVSMPDLMDRIDAAKLVDLPIVIEESGLLARQRAALLTLVAHAQLPLDDLVALARKLSFAEQEQRAQVVGRTDFTAKIAPMIGLMGTLIPLGPGIIALSTGDTTTLSSALLIAFDTTTAGLIVAAVALAVSKFRLRWYTRYSSDLDASMTAIVRRIRDASKEECVEGALAAKRSLHNVGADPLEPSSVSAQPSQHKLSAAASVQMLQSNRSGSRAGFDKGSLDDVERTLASRSRAGDEPVLAEAAHVEEGNEFAASASAPKRVKSTTQAGKGANRGGSK